MIALLPASRSIRNIAISTRPKKPRVTWQRRSRRVCALNRKFAASAPNRIWLADITYIATGEGWLYLASVLDLTIRRIVGWSMRDHMRARRDLFAYIEG